MAIGTGARQSDYLMLALGLVLLFLAFYMIIKYFKNTPLIVANQSTITFGNREVYAFDDIFEVHLTGKIRSRCSWISRWKERPFILKTVPESSFMMTCILIHGR